MHRPAIVLASILAIFIIISGCSHSGPTGVAIRGDESGAAGSMVRNDDHGISNSIGHPWDRGPGVDVRNLPRYIEGEVLVVLNDGIDASAMYPIGKSLGLSLMQTIKLSWGTVYRMSIDGGEPVETMVSKLLGYPEVRYAEPNLILYPCAATTYYPNDPLFEFAGDADNDPWTHMYDQWGPNVLGASLCWPKGKGTPDVVVAVLDTGYRLTHEDLRNQYWINEDEIPDNGIDDDDNGFIDDWRGWDFAAHDNDPSDVDGHGTACSGVVAAEQDNGVGCTGLAPGVKVMAVRCDLTGGGGYTSSVIAGIQYAHDNGADVVSMSFRTYDDSQIMHNTFIAAYEDGEGLLPVGGAGNEDSSELTYPACWPEVMEIGGTCSFTTSSVRRDVRRIITSDYGWGSNWGENLEVMAPGYLYIATHNAGDDQYWDGVNHGTFGGTSCATPCAAGCLGLLKSFHPEMNAAQLRQRLCETADDLYAPGHDTQSGWGRVNVWRAVFGSDPNEEYYDENGHIPIDADDNWNYDNIFDISTSADYDFQDVFVVEAPEAGVLVLELDIITTGEDLDLDVYNTPDLSVKLAEGLGPNGQSEPVEKLALPCDAGQKYYVRVFSPYEYNCSSYKLRARVEKYDWWVTSKSLAPVFVKTSGDQVPQLQLDFETSYRVTLDTIRAYVTGDIPLPLVNSIDLYFDSNGTGAFEGWLDEKVAGVDTSIAGINQVTFGGLSKVCTYDKPLRYFIVANVGPNELGYNVKFGAGLRTYKDVSIEEHIPIASDQFPLLSGLTVLGEDHWPPEWDNTIGVQAVEEGYQSVICYWNNATDALAEPTEYNVYWDDEFPPEISTGMMIENIVYGNGGDYDHAGKVIGLENDKKYWLCVRAIDQEGNEDDNEIWIEASPNGTADPEKPEIVGELDLDGDSWEVSVHNKMAYVANGSNLAMVDCTDPTSPHLVDTYPLGYCYGVLYYEPQDYVYTSHEYGLAILNPDGSDGLDLVTNYDPGEPILDLFVDNDIAYLGGWYGGVYVVDVSDPSDPQPLGETSVGNNQSIYGISARDGYAYCCTVSVGLKIIDATTPSNPHTVKTLTLNKYTYEIQLWDDYALVTNWTNHRVFVIDISDPPNATNVGSLNFSGGYASGVAVRDDQYVYMGRYPDRVWTLDWSDFGDIHMVGEKPTDGPDGLFFDGEFLYAAENTDGLKVIL